MIENITYERERFLDILLLADPSKEIVRDYINRGYLFAIYEEDKVVGAVHIDPLEFSTVEIKNIAIKEEFRGKGFGKHLINHVISFCQTKGSKKIIVGTGNSSIANFVFYQKLGFRFSSIKHNFFLDNYTEEIFENGIQCVDLLILELVLQ